MPIIAVMNQKGGVGKTTIAFNLAIGLAKKGSKVLVVDNDPQGNLTNSFLSDPETNLKANIKNIYKEDYNITPQNISRGLDLIGADLTLSTVVDGNFEIIYRLKEGITQFVKNYDYTIVDCLPSLGFINVAAINAADMILIPTKPAPYSLQGLKDLMNTIDRMKKRLNESLQILGIVINLVEGRKTAIGESLEKVIRETYSNLTFNTKILKGIRLEESPHFQSSIFDYDKNGKNSENFSDFINEFEERIKNQ